MKYIAFLRAINVGGNAIIKMTDLKRMFEAAGLQNVQTYIQSGNVIFESTEAVGIFEKRIESQLEGVAGYKIHFFVRTMRELQSIVRKSPFKATVTENVYVVFLEKKPDQNSRQTLLTFKSNADDFALEGHEVYNLRLDREKSVFSSNFVEKILKMSATARNLTTLEKIVEKYS